MWPRGWVEVWLYSSSTAALEGGEWSAARPGRTLLPGKTRYPFHRILPPGVNRIAVNKYVKKSQKNIIIIIIIIIIIKDWTL